LYLAFYFGIFGCLIYLFRGRPQSALLFFAPCAWALLEYLRSYLFTGFPWALLGLSQYKNLPVIQIADITGAWGVSFLIMMVNVAVYVIARSVAIASPVIARLTKSAEAISMTGSQQAAQSLMRSPRLPKGSLATLRGLLRLRLAMTTIRAVAMTIILLLIVLIYGYYKLLPTSNSQPPTRIKISVIQGNIPQDLKWDWRARNFILNNYKELTSESAKGAPALIIWPEASVPGIFGEDDTVFEQVFSLVGTLNIDLLIGTVSWRSGNYFNSALFIDKSGKPGKIYNKLHLVPFGEFVPFKKTFPFLQAIAPIGDIQPGREYTIFAKPCNFGVLICFEDLFPELSREFVKRGAKFLVNITNDAWYKEGSAAYQHFSASVFRAVENRVYLARAANTGISGFIDPRGRILSVVQDAGHKEIFVKGYSSQAISLAPIQPTFYNRYGDIFILFCLLLLIFLWFHVHDHVGYSGDL
jgi:apolipoprotein N-acyltransferase